MIGQPPNSKMNVVTYNLDESDEPPQPGNLDSVEAVSNDDDINIPTTLQQPKLNIENSEDEVPYFEKPDAERFAYYDQVYENWKAENADFLT